MSDKFGEGRDPYLYPGLKVMRNRLGIRQAQRLEQAAWELTALRAATIELGRWCGDCLISALFIASSIRMSSTGRAAA
ncbi:cell filamentation protein fic [Klebsiella michiganensis]|uniref:Cell filamentation protein fic n=1 Tax=Klebsiella michiganensis TaxID=1134687 RepID=A0A7H4PGK0_9ENTR|nr:cell filamentation protein fic [Klebsiella michiganensis]